LKRLVAVLSLLSAAIALVVPLRAASTELKYVVIISRHGVRSPTWTSDRLNQFSADPWPDWGVPPGYLTARGRTLVTLMGAYYREWLAAENLLARNGCEPPGRVYVWADTDQRTLESGRAIAEGLQPGCGVQVHSLLNGESDPLFDPIEAGLAKPDLEAAAKAVRDRIGLPGNEFLERHQPTFALLQQVLTGGRAAKEMPFTTPSGIDVAMSGGTIDLEGPLRTASTLSENLLLEYANGFPDSQLGWGRLNAETLARVLELHTTYAELMRRTPYLARVRGSNLLAHVLRSLEQAATGGTIPGAMGERDNRVLIVAGHDTNLSNLSGMLGLSWKLEGYPPDDTPPGGALVFSLWKETGTRRHVVQTRYIAQTPEQMRQADRLTLTSPPASQNVSPAGCDPASVDTGCPLEIFERVLQQAIGTEFTDAGRR
jgi:4-phytase/acid phosphatase